MANFKYPKVIFFIEGLAPTEDEAEAAYEIGQVSMRNVTHIGADENAEACDAVASLKARIPEQYSDKPIVKSTKQVLDLARKMSADEANQVAAENAGQTINKGGKPIVPPNKQQPWTPNA